MYYGIFFERVEEYKQIENRETVVRRVECCYFNDPGVSVQSSVVSTCCVLYQNTICIAIVESAT